MDRKFNEEQLETLKKACEEGKYITIEGINFLGEPFTTIAKVSRYDSGKPAVSEDKVAFEFGEEKYSPNSKQTNWFAVYDLNLNINYQLIIKNLRDEKGNIIYEAENFEEIETLAEKKCEENDKKYKDRPIVAEDEVTKALRKRIGQPVTIVAPDGIENGILCNIQGVNDYGLPMYNLLIADAIFGSHAELSMRVLKPNGEVLAMNTPGKTKPCIDKNLKNLQRIKQDEMGN